MFWVLLILTWWKKWKKTAFERAMKCLLLFYQLPAMKSNIWQVRRFLSRKRNARLSNENLAFKKPYKKHAMMNITNKKSIANVIRQTRKKCQLRWYRFLGERWGSRQGGCSPTSRRNAKSFDKKELKVNITQNFD